MRPTPRLFLTALALSTTAFLRAQEGTAPVRVQLDEFGTPVSELRPIPFADGRALPPIPRPSSTLDPSAPIEPLGPADPAKAAPSRSSIEVSTFFPQAATVAIAGPGDLPPSARPAAVQTSLGESEKRGTGGWIVLGLVAAGLLTSIARYRSRLPKRYPVTRAANLTLEPEPVPVPARLN